VGGITEMLKIAALCETHAIGIAPHFTGPISTAALVHVLGPYSRTAIVEIGSNNRPSSHLSEGLELRKGKLWPNARIGLGVTLNMERLTLLTSLNQAGQGRTTYYRPDGSQTEW
jgi:galactonate dehydratase